MGDINDLMEEARNDLNFELPDASSASMKMPIIHEKYARYLMEARGYLKKHEMELQKIYTEKYQYYISEYPLKIDRRDVEKFIKADGEYRKQQSKYEIYVLRVEYINNILKAIDKASWNLGNAIKMHIFQNGG